ncbi:MAG: ornithine carbamoyltransferase [Acidimicrobiia bacterium]|nr:ornithine carbamoyltransferase [Acidimicrobiia bacterium]
MADFLGIADLGVDGLTRVVELAQSVKSEPAEYSRRLTGAGVGLFFMKPSTRTRVSSEMAAVQLGAHPVILGQQEVGLGSRESVADVARVLDRYLDVLAFRVYSHGVLMELAEYADAPVINLLSDAEHPCQAVADLLTISEERPIEGATVTYIGDGNNVCHSLMVGAAMLGASVRAITPLGYEPASQFVELARLMGSGDVTLTGDVDAVEGSDVLYTDVWASMGQEVEATQRAAVFSDYQVDDRMFEAAGEAAIFLHCLPAHRGDEVTDSVIDHPRSRVFDQSENRLHAFKALLLAVTE